VLKITGRCSPELFMFPVFCCSDGDCDGPFPGNWVGSDSGDGDGSGVLGAMGDPVSSTAAAEIEQAVSVMVGLHVSVTVTVEVDVAMGLVLFIAELSIAAKVSVTVVSTGVVAGGCEEDFLPTSLGHLISFVHCYLSHYQKNCFSQTSEDPFLSFFSNFFSGFFYFFSRIIVELTNRSPANALN
jgi:hypothetical protein